MNTTVIDSGVEKELYGVVVGLFHGAPGGYIQELAGIAKESGVNALAIALGDSNAFRTHILGSAVTVADQVAVLMNNFGLSVNGTDSASTAAKSYFTDRIGNGDSYGDIVHDAVVFLLSTTVTEFQATKALLEANIAKAKQFTTDHPTITNIAALQAALTGVNPAIELKIGEDNLTGTSGNDFFSAPIVEQNGGGTDNTLESIDTVDGLDGIDTSSATIDSSAAPVLKNIEVVNLRFTDSGTLNLENSTGVTDINVANSTDDGFVYGIGAAANLSVKNQNQDVFFGDSTATTLGLTLDAAGNTTTPTQIYVDLGDSAASKATTLNVTAKNSNVEVDDSSAAEIIRTLTIAATGENILKMTEAAKATTVTVSGDGSVDLTDAAFTGDLTKFDALTNKGGVQVDIQSAKAVAVSGGDGADTIDMDTTTQGDSSVAAGKGDDKLYVGANLADFNKGADGGEGTDIINITDGATLDSTTAKYITTFETLDVSGGTGTYDVSLNSFATVQIDEAINGALAGAVTFSNAPDSFTLNIASEADTNADFAVGNAITVTGKDYAGTDETFTLVAALHDGNKDNAADGNIDADTITVAGVEKLVIDANTKTLDGGSDAIAASKHTLTADIIAAAATTLTIKGDASVDLSGVTTIGAITKVDATASKGNVTIDFSTHAKSVAYNGAEGVDTYTSGTIGDIIYTAKGADVVDLTASAAARDTFVVKVAADSQMTDTNKDAKVTIAADDIADEVISFTVGGGATDDRLDVTNLGFTVAQRGVVDVSASVTTATDLTNIADLFDSPAGDRGVAYSTDGVDTWVFIDANKDGNFKAADDLIVQLTGVTTLSETDINF